MNTHYRSLPSVDRILAHPEVAMLIKVYSRDAVTNLIRDKLEEARISIKAGNKCKTLEEVSDDILAHAQASWRVGPTPIINATGVILHTNLGRSPLSLDALESIIKGAKGYSDLEFETDTGQRGSRQSHIEQLIKQVTGAESAVVVNNNASAILLALTSLSSKKEVIVSRGEAVEIGGGFRIPDVLSQSGATLVEIGTTNRTYIRDYERAITHNTSLILKIHPSNFQITGFTETTSIQELVKLGKKYDIPICYDIGSGALLDTSRFGLAHEPTVQESISSGVDLTFFSGDKLLGGPQAGIIAGQAKLIRKIEKHPLARAIRIDKLSLLALSATLLHYLRDEATKKIPVWRMISESSEELEKKASEWKDLLGSSASIKSDRSTIGGGSLPSETLPTWVVSISPGTARGSAKNIAARLRTSIPSVIARVADECVLLDPRTVLPEENQALIKSVKRVIG